MNNHWIKRIECILAGLLSIAVLLFLFVRATHAGGIWRDEANSVQIAVLPTVRDIWNNLAFDSFPLLFNLILRTYVDLFGTSDVALRAFGVAIGALMLAVGWWNARALGAGVPLIFLTFVGTNATWLVSGTATRGYGAGTIAILVAFGLATNLVTRPNRKRLFVFAIVCLAAVHLVYFNIALVAAISVGMVVVFVVQKRLDFVVAVVAIAAVCFISWTPYLQMLASLDWRIVLTAADVSAWNILINWGAAVGNGTIALALIWFALVLALLVAGAGSVISSLRRYSPARLPLLFTVTTALAALVSQYLVLRAVGYSPQPRYFLGLFAIMTLAAESVLSAFARFNWVRAARCAFAAAIFLISCITAWPKLTQRQTNIDIVALTLQQNAAPNDLIVIDRESVGVSFNWYYRGNTHWDTVPILIDHRFQRDDLVKAKMMETEPVRDLENEIANALRAANRVWLVHDPKLSKQNMSLAPPASAPDPRVGWNEWAYREAWARDIMLFLENHSESVHVALPSLPNDGAVENVTVFLVQGWRD